MSVQQSAAMGLVVMEASASPASPKTLLIHRVSKEDIYMQQCKHLLLQHPSMTTHTAAVFVVTRKPGQCSYERDESKGQTGATHA